jgi:hypothetical protein
MEVEEKADLKALIAILRQFFRQCEEKLLSAPFHLEMFAGKDQRMGH